MVEKAAVERLLVQLEEYLRDLDSVKQSYSLEDYKENKIIRRYTERTLQIAIEACLDLASHNETDNKYEPPLLVMTKSGGSTSVAAKLGRTTNAHQLPSPSHGHRYAYCHKPK